MSNIDMNTTDSDFNETGNENLSIVKIKTSDTISEFMEKVNNNFTNILNHGGGPRGVDGDRGQQGVPTKPKVPIHVWVKGVDYFGENEETFEIIDLSVDLTDVKYQEGHLIILENAHVYILENNSNFELTPKFIMALQSYDPGEIVHGKNAYVHFAYADSENGDEGFIVDNQLIDKNLDINTFGLTGRINAIDKPYMGIYSDRQIISSNDPSRYTWVRIQGKEGIAGIQGVDGKSRVLFYLGSFEKDKATLSGTSVIGRLNDEICDYYIDYDGYAWMRTGTKREAKGPDKPDTQNSEFLESWRPSTQVGFLQAGAITADMINARSLTANNAFITAIQAIEINADKITSGTIDANNVNIKNLTVDATQINGTLTFGDGTNDTVGIDGTIPGRIITKNSITTEQINVNDLKVSGFIDAFEINADKITSGTIDANNVNITNLTVSADAVVGTLQIGSIGSNSKVAIENGAITAQMLDIENISVVKLNTKPNVDKSSVVVQDNKVLIKDDGGYDICKFCDDEIDANLNDAFKERKPVNITYYLSTAMIYTYKIDPTLYTEKISYIPTETTTSKTVNIERTTNNSIKYDFGDPVNNKIIASNKIVTFVATIRSIIDATTFYSNSKNTICNLTVKVIPIITVYRSGSSNPVYTYVHNGTEHGLNNNTKTVNIDSNIEFKFITPAEDKYSFTLNFKLIYESTMSGDYVSVSDAFTHSIQTYSMSSNSGTIKINFGGYANNTRSEIYKNGMLIQNEMNGILVCEDGILLKFNNYGIKLDANGISYATNLLNYQNDLSNANWTTNWGNLNK